MFKNTATTITSLLGLSLLASAHASIGDAYAETGLGFYDVGNDITISGQSEGIQGSGVLIENYGAGNTRTGLSTNNGFAPEYASNSAFVSSYAGSSGGLHSGFAIVATDWSLTNNGSVDESFQLAADTFSRTLASTHGHSGLAFALGISVAAVIDEDTNWATFAASGSISYPHDVLGSGSGDGLYGYIANSGNFTDLNSLISGANYGYGIAASRTSAAAVGSGYQTTWVTLAPGQSDNVLAISGAAAGAASTPSPAAILPFVGGLVAMARRRKLA